MRLINKALDDITNFNNWAKSNKLQNWSDFSSPHSQFYTAYLTVRNHIKDNEQDCLSSYTEKPLSDSIHIDHFRNKSIYPKLTFDYSNFLVDDLNDNYGACYKDNHAGVAKSTFDGKDRIFCPVAENMADYIDFTFNGTMLPKDSLGDIDTNRVKETIRVFNLNHRTLKDKRGDIIRIIKEYKGYGLSDVCIREAMGKAGFPTLVDWVLSKI